jgi:hypothetical protein
METVGCDYEIDSGKPKEVRYGRRASKTKECDSPTQEYPYEDRQGYGHSSDLPDKVDGSAISKSGRRSVKQMITLIIIQ